MPLAPNVDAFYDAAYMREIITRILTQNFAFAETWNVEGRRLTLRAAPPGFGTAKSAS